MRIFSMPWLVQWLGRMLHTQTGSRVVLLMYMYFQHCAEKTRSRLRKRILEQDLALSKVMSFTRF
jgi:hypothetical protein